VNTLFALFKDKEDDEDDKEKDKDKKEKVEWLIIYCN
jgi:hypothetical protein